MKKLQEKIFLYTIRYGNIEEVEYLLDKGEELNSNAMSAAVRSGKAEVVKLLLDKGASVTSENFSAAIASDNFPIMKLLLDRGASITADDLWDAVDSNNGIKSIKLLLDSGASVTSEALTSAIFSGKVKIVKLFLEKLHKAPSWTVSIAAGSPILGANSQVKMIELLLDKGAAVTSGALIAAINTRKVETIKLLLDKGAEVTSEALIEAIYTGKVETIELLLDKGANVTFQSLYASIFNLGVDPKIVAMIFSHFNIEERMDEQNEAVRNWFNNPPRK